MSDTSRQNERIYLTIDQGGQTSRAQIYDSRCRLISQAHRAIRIRCPRAGYAEYNALELLHSLHEAIDAAMAQLGTQREQPCVAALATQRSNVVCWDKFSGQPLSPIISWQDRRNTDWLQQFAAEEAHIHRTTGLFKSAHYGAGKLHWCLHHLPAVRRARIAGRLAMGPMASFLTHNLLTERPLYCDPVSASRTLLWDITRRDWAPELLRLFGLPLECLPACVPSHYSYGTLRTRDISVPLRLVTGDQAAALFAREAPDNDTIFVTLGTGGFIQRLGGSQNQFSPTLLSSVILQQDHSIAFTLEGTINGAGSALQWYQQQQQISVDFQRLEEALSRPSEPPLFINGVSGLGTPFMTPFLESAFIGPGNQQQQQVAIIESIAFLAQLNIEAMWSLPGKPEKIIAGGGLARLDGLCQRLADLSGLPLFRDKDHETTCRGLAQLLGANPPPDDATPLTCFKPQTAGALQTRYRRWQTILADSVRQVREAPPYSRRP